MAYPPCCDCVSCRMNPMLPVKCKEDCLLQMIDYDPKVTETWTSFYHFEPNKNQKFTTSIDKQTGIEKLPLLLMNSVK